MRISALISALGAGVALAMPLAAAADHFGYRRAVVGGQERGVVTSHGMALFQIASAAGGRSPVQRAQAVARRLEDSLDTDDPRFFSVGFQNGELVIQQQEQSDLLPHVIVTIDRRLAPPGDAERLAQWWLALLRDHLALALGERPRFTAGTPIGAVFAKVYSELGAPHTRIAAEDIARAMDALTDGDRDILQSAAVGVPDSFDPGRAVPSARDSSSAAQRSRQPADAIGQAPARHSDDQGQYRVESQPAPGDEKPSPADGAQPARPNSGVEPNSTDRSAETAGRQSADVPGDGAPAPSLHLRQTSGDYAVTLLTDSSSLQPGQQANLRLRVVYLPTRDDVEDATVRAWFTRAGGRAKESLAATFDPDAGAYELPLTLPTGGEYQLTVGILTESADMLKVVFPLALGAAGADRGADAHGDAVSTDRTEAAVRHIGGYALKLTTRPAPPIANSACAVELSITDESAHAPMTGGRVRVWLLAGDDTPDDSDAIVARSSDDDSAYRARVRFGKPGDYRLVVRVETPNGGRFKAEFPIAGVEAAPDTGDPAGSASPQQPASTDRGGS